MAGSGTALVEALLAGRRAVGVDLDQLATLIARAKVGGIDAAAAVRAAEDIVRDAGERLAALGDEGWARYLDSRAPATREFIDYWFESETARALAALSQAVRARATGALGPLFATVLSSLIVTKSGGVSRARDLAHSRPHRVEGRRPRDPMTLFADKALKAVRSLDGVGRAAGAAVVLSGDARRLPLGSESVDLVVTSPPYANAIDHVRAHKFSLVWLGSEVSEMAARRRRYIGAEGRTASVGPLDGPLAEKTVDAIAAVDRGRSRVVRRYFSEMTDVLRETRRVLKPGRAAVVVVGSSTVRGVAVPTPFVLAELAEAAGFRVVGVRERPIDRDRRLMPARSAGRGAGIEARMHSEHVIGLVRPASSA